MPQKKPKYLTAQYERLSREDGDRMESDSILNQQRLIEDYCAREPEFQVVGHYSDDGYTGTNFDRPAFQRMVTDIEVGKVNCVVVKDLSRFGRDYIDMGYYLERYFPSHEVRFIAINDGVDSQTGPYNMLLPLKNVFNAQYAKDISEKVRSSFEVKQRRGEFVGAFTSYGYAKDPADHNKLVVDPVAARVVRRVFELAAGGAGQIRIAQQLNEEKVPCPSEYKRLMGERYTNCKRLESTHYWTYATIHRMLQNEMYRGSMVQRRSIRPTMHGRAKATDKSQWVVVPDTHEAIIPQELWDAVQAQISQNTRAPAFEQNVGLFAGFLKCGDCGRAMVKTARGGRIYYSCGSYRRYGASVCTKHYIPQQDIEEIILGDLNRVIAAVGDLKQLAERNRTVSDTAQRKRNERKRLEAALDRVRRLKQGAYEDYRDRLLSREEFLRYKGDYNQQEGILTSQLAQVGSLLEEKPLKQPWVENLLRLGRLTELDRATLSQTVEVIRIFEDKRIEITYRFSDSLRFLLEEEHEGPS